ncbi:MAG TPA: ribosome maturation factor RimM [Azospirillaceae bacterium]|nr:ribosome maturation factor RimM [Azospirillaceae bacterium]
MADRVCVGQFVGAHGVHGRVKLKSFTDVPESIFAYGPLTDEKGTRTFPVKLTGMGKDHFLAEVEGLRDRDAAEALKGTRVYVERARLPEPEDEDEFYHADLIGLETVTEGGEPFGTILAIYDFGAGDVLEIRHASGKTVSIPFTRECVPVVAVKEARVVVAPPANLFAKARPSPEELAEMEGGPPADEVDLSGGDAAGEEDRAGEEDGAGDQAKDA